MRLLGSLPTIAVLLLYVLSRPASAGDDASGPVHYSLDLSQPFTIYAMTQKDKEWGQSLAKKFGYHGRIIHFMRTSLPLVVDNQTVTGEVYQAIEKPEILYVLQSDAMLQLHTRWPYNPGVLGFSMHGPRSRNFLVAFNFFATGVPFLSSTPVENTKITWQGHVIDRLKE